MELKQGRLSLRLTDEEKKLIRKRAIDKDIKISKYIMDLVERDFQNSKHNNSLNVEYGKVESSIKCISEMVNNFKEHDKTAMTPLLHHTHISLFLVILSLLTKKSFFFSK